MRIAVSFDGTIVENKYPDIGRERPNAIRTLRNLEAEGNDIILWTSRSGVYLEEAVLWCRARKLEFYAINRNNPDDGIQSAYSRRSPKIVADMFIDANNIGGIPAWNDIYHIANKHRHELHKKSRKPRRKKNTFWSRLALAWQILFLPSSRNI